MFAKIYDSIYDGTLAEHWEALVTFQQLLILATADGVVDMTPTAIHRRTGIPLAIITEGLRVLSEPDPQSRSPDMEGRRIAPLQTGRAWGWFIVNHAEYRRRISLDEKREADRQRIAGKRAESREVSQGVAESREASRGVAKVAHTDTDTEIASQDADASCSAGDGHSRARVRQPAPEPAITLPLNDGSEYPITPDQVREFSGLYPAVDVLQQLRSMRGWCVSNPTKRKTRAGILRFVNHWLAKVQNQGPPQGGLDAGSTRTGASVADRAATRARQIAERSGVSLD